MRALIATGLLGMALASLAGCNKAAQTPAGAPAASAAAPAASPTAQDLPHRKAGLWRQTISIQGHDQIMPASQVCSDASSEAKLTLLGQRKSKDLCQTQAFSRNPDGSIGFDVRCDLGAHGKTASHGTITGDFNSTYKMAIDTQTTGAPYAAANGERKMTITATWIGPCAPGQKGGDMVMADGRTVNLIDAAPRSR